MARLGETLRAQRERKGISLEQAADDTRIREKFLAALESGDYQSLPGAIYTKGLLRNYADYLDVDSNELVALFQVERGPAEQPARQFEPMRPIMRRSVILTPAILLPLVVLGGVALFVGYFYYQFTAFATPPRIEVIDPAGDTIVDTPELVVRGRTVPDGRVTVRVFPGPETIADVRPAANGTFAVPVHLRPGANHIEVQVLDAAGKTNLVSRSVRLETVAIPIEPPPQLIVEEPANSSTYTNAPVAVSGRVDRVVTSLAIVTCPTCASQPLAVTTDGRFRGSINYPAGTHAVRFVARSATGGEVTETRTVTVAFTAAVVTVIIQGGDAWLLARVDGVQAEGTGRIFTNGTSATFTGRQVTIRTGNAGATTVIYNGQLLGTLGTAGQVVDRTFTLQ